MGSNFENNRGNATLFFHYKKDQAILQKDRDYSACATRLDFRRLYLRRLVDVLSQAATSGQ